MKKQKNTPYQKYTGALVSARMNSSRLPGKMLLDVCGKPVLQHLIERLTGSETLETIVIATTNSHIDNSIISLAQHMGVGAYRGSEDDVLSRVTKAAKAHQLDIVVDITGDCPLIDPKEIDKMVLYLKENDYDYVSNIYPRSWPDGFDIQVYKLHLLEAADIVAEGVHRCHSGWNIMQYKKEIQKHWGYKLKAKHFKATGKYFKPHWGLTLDEESDYILLQVIFNYFKKIPKGDDFSQREVMDFLLKFHHLLVINNDVKRKEPGNG